MTPIVPFAHAGHWLVSLAYLMPLLVLVVAVGIGKVRERRAGDRPPPERLED
jgi:hypothetical protein